MLHPIKIFDPDGKLKKRIADPSRVFWESFDREYNCNTGNTIMHRHRKARQRPERDFTCAWCGKLQKTRSEKAKWCSKACSSRGNNKRKTLARIKARGNLIKTCPRCHQNFTPRDIRQVYCRKPCTSELARDDKRRPGGKTRTYIRAW